MDGTVSMLEIFFCHYTFRPNQLNCVIPLKFKGASSNIVVYSLPMKTRTIVNNSYLSRIRHTNRSQRANYCGFARSNNIIALHDFFANCLTHSSLGGGARS